MAYTIIQTVETVTTSAGTTFTVIPTASNVVLNNRIIVFASWYDSGITGITCVDNQSNSFSLHTSQYNSGAPGTTALWSLVVPSNIAGTKPTVTITIPSGGGYMARVLMEVSGLNTVNGLGALDMAAVSNLSTTATSPATATLGSASRATGNCVIACYGDRGSGITVTKDATYNQDANNSPGPGSSTACVADKLSTAGTTETVSWGMSAGTEWNAVIASFLLAQSGGFLGFM